MAGQEVPTLGSVTYEGDRAVQSIVYRSSGVIFELMPEVTRDAIRLNVRQQISSFIRTETGVDNSPTLTKRELDTTVSIQDGEVIILGGLEESATGKGEEGLSFLPSWFRGRRESSESTEIMLLLHAERI
jgi:type II secretory pathway component GspD/PulD (secretin)